MAALPPELFRRWVHAREEDEYDLLVYRPRGFPLPPARGRRGFELSADGGFVENAPGPTDRSEARHGHWTPAGSRCALVSFPDPDAADLKLEIVSVDPDRLVLRRA